VFFEHLLHELAHDFSQSDESDCLAVGIEPLTYQECEADEARKAAVSAAVERLCDPFNSRLMRS
jgi:hypothetical protein